MFAHPVYKWMFGGLLSVALVGLPACQSAPKTQPQALTGQVEKQEVKKPHKHYRFHGKGIQWQRQQLSRQTAKD